MPLILLGSPFLPRTFCPGVTLVFPVSFAICYLLFVIPYSSKIIIKRTAQTSAAALIPSSSIMAIFHPISTNLNFYPRPQPLPPCPASSSRHASQPTQFLPLHLGALLSSQRLIQPPRAPSILHGAVSILAPQHPLVYPPSQYPPSQTC